MFIDESGLMMAPLVRRSWAPRGRTPVLIQRTASHRKVSVIAALGVDPGRQGVRLVFRLHPNANFRSREIIAFLGQLDRHFRAPLVIVWDRLAAHRSAAVRRWLRRHRRLRVELLPPYAPELNPVEFVWAYVKSNGLANFAPRELNGTNLPLPASSAAPAGPSSPPAVDAGAQPASLTAQPRTLVMQESNKRTKTLRHH